MYSVNGVPLDNPELGWALMRPSRPLGDYSVDRTSVSAPWRDGVASGIPGAFAAPTRTLVVQTPRRTLEALLALLHEDGNITQTGYSDRVLPFETLSTSPAGLGVADELLDVSWTVRLPTVFWRDPSPMVEMRTFKGGGVYTWDLFYGMTGPVSDVEVLVRGVVIGGLRLTDSSGAFVAFQESLTAPVEANQYMSFDARSGASTYGTWAPVPAAQMATAPWARGTRRDRQVVFGGPRRRFELTSVRAQSPLERVGRLQVGVPGGETTIFMRARRNYLTPPELT